MTHEIISLPDKEILQFFGRVNASISHELKNILAIISETTGFLDDLVQLSRQGKQFDLSILENSNKSIAEEIERGFHTIRQMNKFAHSVDEMQTETDVAECTMLAANLSAFLSYAKPVRISEPAAAITVQTVPIMLISLIYQVICSLSRAKGVDGMSVSFEAGKEEVSVIFSVPNCSDDSCVPPELIQNYKSLLKIDLRFGPNADILTMAVPHRIE